MSKPVVAILMGSASDVDKVSPAMDVLREFNIPFAVRVMSAHRSPDVVCQFVSAASAEGYKIIIAAAGGAAHLAGVTAAHTCLPVIGIPVECGPFHGFDSLLSTVQMPGGIPVATVAVGSAGARNAGLLAIRILALGDPRVAEQLARFHTKLGNDVVAADEELQRKLSG